MAHLTDRDLLIGAMVGACLLAAVGAARADTVALPGSSFLMGSESGEPAEAPVHRVAVSAFALERREVSNARFARFVAATGHVTDAERAGSAWHWDGRWHRVAGATWRQPHGDGSATPPPDHPVVQVSWHDARAYCRWRGRRLPTEAEWERAARGSAGRTYAWGDEAPSVHRAAYGTERCCAASDDDGHRFTAPIGSFPAGRTPEGIDDLTGNVWEWVEDTFDPAFYARSPARDPVNAAPGEERVIRGGGWGNNPWGLRATLRHANAPHFALSMVGFRCAAGGPDRR